MHHYIRSLAVDGRADFTFGTVRRSLGGAEPGTQVYQPEPSLHEQVDEYLAKAGTVNRRIA